jgi:hypothetical protein
MSFYCFFIESVRGAQNMNQQTRFLVPARNMAIFGETCPDFTQMAKMTSTWN